MAESMPVRGSPAARNAGTPATQQSTTDSQPSSGHDSLPLPAVLGEYELLDRLGSGGMGEVFKARHRRLGKLVALKVLTPERRESRPCLDRFRREMAAVGQLQHAHLVQAHDAGEQGGAVYLALEYIPGTDLQRYVQERGPLPVGEACELVRQAALGIAHLHERGLVHRDIKPSNLLRTPEGLVKVLDLGLARWVDGGGSSELTQAGAIMGTPDYVAPEQAESAACVDVRADLYGLGGTLFYLLTGQGPFAHHSSGAAKVMAHMSELPDLRPRRPDVPPEVEAVVLKLLAKEADRRFASAAALAAELGRLGARLNGKTEQRVSWRVGVGLTAALLVLGMGGLGLASFWGKPATQATEPSREPGGTSRVNPLAVQRFEVEHLAREGRFDRPRGSLGKQSFAAVVDDNVTVSAQLSRPAYCFLIAFRPDGAAEVCFPDDAAAPPPLTDRPRYPITPGVTYGLTDGAGLQVFALVVSSKPLPAYQDWQQSRGTSPWRPVAALPDVVWRYDGVELLAFTADNPGGTRGKGRSLRGGETLTALLEWLRQGPDTEIVEAVAFPVNRPD